MERIDVKKVKRERKDRLVDAIKKADNVKDLKKILEEVIKMIK